MGGRVGARQLAQLQESLSPRDWAIARSLADYRYLSARQIERLHFPVGKHTPLSAARSARRVLARLAASGVLLRLDRRVGGVRAGSAGYIYALGSVGQRLLAGKAGSWREPSRYFLDHTLAVAELRLRLVEAHRAGSLELISSDGEPACWRQYVGPAAARSTLKPDLHAVVASGEVEHHWFVEVDLGSEHRPALRRKCRAYLDYWQVGREQQQSGIFPRVLWLAGDEARLSVLAEAMVAMTNAPTGLFVVSLTTQAVAVLAGKDRL